MSTISFKVQVPSIVSKVKAFSMTHKIPLPGFPPAFRPPLTPHPLLPLFQVWGGTSSPFLLSCSSCSHIIFLVFSSSSQSGVAMSPQLSPSIFSPRDWLYLHLGFIQKKKCLYVLSPTSLSSWSLEICSMLPGTKLTVQWLLFFISYPGDIVQRCGTNSFKY